MIVPHEQVDEIARTRSHRGRFSQTHYGVLGDPHRIDTIGVIGEWVFAVEFGFSPSVLLDVKTRENFRLSDGCKVDVRSSESAGMLIVQPKRVYESDVFVLAAVDLRKYSANLLGWATSAELARTPPQRISSSERATPVHAIGAKQLRPMRELLDRHRSVEKVAQLTMWGE